MVSANRLVTIRVFSFGQAVKFTKITQINYIITRMTFLKIIRLFFLFEIAFTHSYNKKNITKISLAFNRWQIYFFKNVNLLSNKFVYKICIEK